MGYVRVCDLCGKPMSEPGKKYRIKEQWVSWYESGWRTVEAHDECVDRLLGVKSRPVKEGENITENNPVDEFVCSECGIIIEGWLRVEIDEDDGERTYHENIFRFCPNCGAKMGGTP